MAVSSVKTKSVEAAGGEIKPASPPVKGFQFAGGDPGSPQIPKSQQHTKNAAHRLTKNKPCWFLSLLVGWLVG